MFQENVALSVYSSYKIGGRAKYFYEACGLHDLLLAVKLAKEKSLAVFIFGGGTNLLIDEDGFDGLVLKPNIKFIHASHPEVANGDRRISVGAGVLVADLLNFCVDHSLSGLEWAGGLPGTVGGAIRGNAGAFGGEIKDIIAEVSSLKFKGFKTPEIIKRNKDECRFGYRNSIFKTEIATSSPFGENQKGWTRNDDVGEIIISATLNLKRGNQEEIKKAIQEKIDWRKNKHPMEHPNIGSIFKNIDWAIVPVVHQESFKEKIKKDPFLVLPTAVVIDRCGLKGVSYGGAMISPKHPNFIVNTLGATASDVKNLIQLIKDSVRQKYDIELEEEVQCL